ncbi:MAG TPA: aspartyl protease family protein [Croceibacterium sp.]|nr:aspartyl protease family protein [Croceibacterium sp.]
MRWHPVATLAAALSLGLTGTALAQDPRADPSVEVLSVDHDPYKRMTIPVTIGGQGPFPFLIDTGAQATVLSRGLADRLQLNDRKTATLVGMASRQQVETTPVDDFTLGSRSFYVRQAPLVEGQHIGEGADGILGLDALQDQRVVLDFNKGEIAVADAAEKGGNRGYEIVVKARERLGQLIITKARLDGVTVDVIIDTGAQGSVGNLALLNRLRRAREIGETEMTDINGVTLAGALRLGRELQIGDANIRNLRILFADTSTFGSLGLSSRPALILGMSELKLFQRVAIDFRTRRVLFDLPADVAFEARRPLIQNRS